MRYFSSILFVSFFWACNNNSSTKTILDEAPYKPLTDSIHRFATNAELRYRRGMQLYQFDENALAAADFKKAWELKMDERYAFAYAEAIQQKEPQAAIDFLKNALQNLPQSLPLQLQLVKLYQQRGARSEALAMVMTARQKYPASLDAVLLQAELVKDTDPTTATALLEQATQLAPDDVQLQHQLAYYYAENKNRKTLPLADALIKKDSAGISAEPYYFKGLYYANMGNNKAALQHFDAAIQHDHNFMNAYINKGIVYYDAKDYNRAAQTFALSTQINPAFAEGWYWQGKTEEARGNIDAAKFHYQRAFGLDKELKEARAALDRLG